MYYTPQRPNHFNFTPHANLNGFRYQASPTSGVNEPPLSPQVMSHPTNHFTENIPTTMPWASTEPSLMRFTASQSQAYPLTPAFQPFAPTSSYPSPVLVTPDPCSSRTATQWELFNRLSSPTTPLDIRNGVRLKRRTSSDDDSDYDEFQPPTKIALTEEKVAARFRCMNIGSDQEKMTSEDIEVEEELDGQIDLKFHLSEEVKSAITSPNIMAHDQLARLEREKSSKALVLWSPPPTATLSNLINSTHPEVLQCFNTEKSSKSEKNDIADVKIDPIDEELADMMVE
jgi:hypothetical protein